MDYERLIVEAKGLDSFSEFGGPEWVARYMTVLEHTPVNAAGMNCHSVLRLKDKREAVERLGDIETVSSIMNAISPFVPVETTQRYAQITG
ncbi:MAG: hypothetical protein V2B18_15215 [Pseudomonadota bacterium]